jgi:tRNA pseudouridine55 synthase
VLLIDKPSGPTSHDIVARIRGRFRLRKVGHGGTLDPQATGLLVLLMGRGTKLAAHFIGADKCYEGVLRLGVATDTHDAAGHVVREADWSGVTREALEAQMNRFRGDILQTPPMVSAVKVGGLPLYKRARKGQDVEREPRLVHIYRFDLLDFRPPDAAFVMKCTKGTYVRTICSDIGDGLGCGAHLASLRRLRCGDMDVADAVPFDEVLRMDREALTRRIIPMSRFVGA